MPPHKTGKHKKKTKNEPDTADMFESHEGFGELPSEDTPLNLHPVFMGDLPGHSDTDYTVPLDSLQGENSGEGPATSTKYNYNPHNTMTNLVHWRGTVLPGLMTRPLVWASLSTFFSASICRQGFNDTCGKYMPLMVMGELNIMGALLTFFLAFYTTSCYNRFLNQYTHLKQIEGTMRSIAIQVRMFYLLPAREDEIENVSPEQAAYRSIELLRYLGATYYLVFARLYDGEDRTFDLDSAHEEGLLTSEECNHLQNMSPSMRWFRVLCWAFEMVSVMGKNEGLEEIPLDKLHMGVLDMRREMNSVTYEAQMPIPLPYYHVITVLCFGFILTYSYSCAFLESSPGVAWLIYAFPVFGFAGMREVAIEMADPFGDDDIDLPVDVYVHNIMKFLVDFLVEDPRPGMQTFHNSEHWAERHVGNDRDRKDIQTAVEDGQALEKKALIQKQKKARAAWKAVGKPLFGKMARTATPPESPKNSKEVSPVSTPPLTAQDDKVTDAAITNKSVSKNVFPTKSASEKFAEGMTQLLLEESQEFG